MKALNYGSFAFMGLAHNVIFHDHVMRDVAFVLVALRLMFMLATIRKAVR